MINLNLPKFPIKVISRGEKFYVWDNIRKKHIILTPEEWVRQHFVNYLITRLAYPQNLIGNEVELKLNKLKKRADTIVYDKFGEPLVLIEYKAPYIDITQKTFDQIYRYNIVFKVKHLIISNGLTHYYYFIDYKKQTISQISDIPLYSDL